LKYGCDHAGLPYNRGLIVSIHLVIAIMSCFRIWSVFIDDSSTIYNLGRVLTWKLCLSL